MEIIKKSIFLSFVVFLSFFCYIQTTNASVIQENSIMEEYRLFDGEESLNCGGILGSPEDHRSPAYWLQWILDIVKYVAIAALLILSTVDFIKAMISNDRDGIKKASITTAKRFVYCVLIFFAPILVDLFMSLLGLYGSCTLG